MVVFSAVESASQWAENSGFEYPLLVDTNRALYLALRLRRSVVIWSLSALIRYAEQLHSGVKLLRSYEGDDFHQMGGDFVVDSRGKLIYVYHGKTSYDRPTVNDLLAHLEPPDL